MIYVAWGALYEGATDKYYFDVLIPRLIEQLLLDHGVTKFVVPETSTVYLQRGDVDAIAREICENQDSLVLAFIHADTGGRAQETSLGRRGGNVASIAEALCGFDHRRIILVAPRHEMEAWALADCEAVCSAFGYRGNPSDIGLPTTPQQAEALVDPKATLRSAMLNVRGRRSSLPLDLLYPVIAQEQSFNKLAACGSFSLFRGSVLSAIRTLNGVPIH